MRKIVYILSALAISASGTLLIAQPLSRGRGGDVVAPSVAKMMTFDTNEDGKLSRSEVTDPRLSALFDRADEDKDGAVSKDELIALFTREAAAVRSGGPGRFDGRGAGPDRPSEGAGGPAAGFGGPPPGGPEGPGGFGPRGGPPGGPPRPGQILPGFLQDELQLTRRQRAQLERLQADVDERLAKILTDEQAAQLAEMSNRGPGGRRGPGGPPDNGADFGPPPREQAVSPPDRRSRGRRPSRPAANDEQP
ncbi:MAG TPA: hypothetical protein VFI31_04770 [Pirellulales bacterium]|nr:hypothetical protein [Pirellulales bacterium]